MCEFFFYFCMFIKFLEMLNSFYSASFKSGYKSSQDNDISKWWYRLIDEFHLGTSAALEYFIYAIRHDIHTFIPLCMSSFNFCFISNSFCFFCAQYKNKDPL